MPMPTRSAPISGLQIRRIVLAQSRRAHVGHIGCALSVADIVAAMYGGIMRINGPDDPARDRFVLSKGHAALAVYAALHLRGWLPLEALNGYTGDGTLLGVHPEKQLAGIEFATGSLGQGIAYAAGAALAARMRGSSHRVFALLSDGECNEGSVWETALFAAQHKLANLTVVIDANGQQALGYTDQVLSPTPLAGRWRAFGWDVHEVDGHDEAGLKQAVDALVTTAGPPHVLVARTTFGKGVSFMQNQIKWHYWPMSEQEYRQALAEIGG